MLSDMLGDIGVRPRRLKSLSPGRAFPLGMRHQSNPRFLNCTKGDLCDPGAGSARFVLEICNTPSVTSLLSTTIKAE
jgi:hypothetical protein